MKLTVTRTNVVCGSNFLAKLTQKLKKKQKNLSALNSKKNKQKKTSALDDIILRLVIELAPLIQSCQDV